MTILIPPGYGPVTGALIDVLKGGKPGDEITDERLTSVCLHDTSVGGPGYGNLLSAVNYVERNHGVVWQRVRGERKLHCQDNTGCYHVGKSRLGTSRRFASRAVRVMMNVDTDTLPEPEREDADGLRIISGMVAALCRHTTIKRASKLGLAEVPSPAKMLESMKE